jgi:hypothetical protein
MMLQSSTLKAHLSILRTNTKANIGATDRSIATELSHGLKKGKQLKLVDQHLKHLDENTLKRVIAITNEDLAWDNTRLQIELKDFISGFPTNMHFFELTLKENGKLVALDSWSKQSPANA